MSATVPPLNKKKLLPSKKGIVYRNTPRTALELGRGREVAAAEEAARQRVEATKKHKEENIAIHDLQVPWDPQKARTNIKEIQDLVSRNGVLVEASTENLLTPRTTKSVKTSHIHLSDKQIVKIKTVFEKFDKDASGEIDKEEFIELIYALGDERLNAKAPSMFEKVDNDGSGQVSFEELIKALSDPLFDPNNVNAVKRSKFSVTMGETIDVDTWDQLANKATTAMDLNAAGNMYFHKDNFEKAMDYYEQAMLMYSDNVTFYQNRERAANELERRGRLSWKRWMGQIDIKDLRGALRSAVEVIRRKDARELISKKLRIHNKERVDKLLKVFDHTEGYSVDRSQGYIDKKELAMGLSALVGGSRSEKLEFAFKIFDVNHDGVIIKNEMKDFLTHYLTSSLKAALGARSSTLPPDKQEDDIDAKQWDRVDNEVVKVMKERLALIKGEMKNFVEENFKKADADGNGMVSFKEFMVWGASSPLLQDWFDDIDALLGPPEYLQERLDKHKEQMKKLKEASQKHKSVVPTTDDVALEGVEDPDINLDPLEEKPVVPPGKDGSNEPDPLFHTDRAPSASNHSEPDEDREIKLKKKAEQTIERFHIQDTAITEVFKFDQVIQKPSIHTPRDYRADMNEQAQEEMKATGANRQQSRGTI